MASSQGKLSAADISVIVVYLVCVIAVGLWSMFQSKRGTVSGYFLAGRFMTFLPVGMSLFASNIGSDNLVGLAGSGAAGGIGIGTFEINALIFIQLLGFVFLPVYIASGVYTLPEFIHKRFGCNRIRVLLSVLSLILYIFAKISVNMYSGALFIQQTVGWNLYLSIVGLLLLTGICTVTGGLAAVMYLDTLMAFVMVVGATVMSIIGFQKVGGYSGLRNNFVNAVPDEVLANKTLCGIPKQDAFILLRDPVNSDIPWVGLIFGQTAVSIWYWCTDQVTVQRALAAKSLSHAQGGCVLASYLKILPMFIMVMPGMISRILFPNEVGCVDPDKCESICGSRSGCTNIAMPKLVLEIMPSGLRGMMLVVMMAALMSDLTSIFNSASTLFTIDIYQRIRKRAGTRELMIVGRVFVVVLCIIGIAWVPIMMEVQGGQLAFYIQAVNSYLSPPIAAVYVMAIFWKRSNEVGAFWAMIVGFLVGITRMVLDFSYPAPRCGEEDTRPSIVKDVHFFYVALVLFFLTAIVCVVVSLLTDPPGEELTIRTTVWTIHDQTTRKDEIDEDQELKENDKQEQRILVNSSASYGGIELHNRNTKDETSQIVFSDHKSACHKLTNFICGLNDVVEEEKKDAEEQKSHLKDIISLQQDRRAKLFLRVNCILVLLVCLFLLIYFSVPDGGPRKPTIPIPYPPFLANGTRPEL